MERMRKPAEGVWNVVRFNWHFYAIAGVFLTAGLLLSMHLPQPFDLWLRVLCLATLVAVTVSLVVSHIVYDRSPLYSFEWLEEEGEGRILRMANVHAGFDETSRLLRSRFPHSELVVLDFYDPVHHTEVSIKRARRAYPSYPGTLRTNTAQLPLKDASLDRIVVFLSAHEIRDERERIRFFQELNRTLKPEGEISVTEHLRDVSNFAAYSLGFFHFHSRKTWLRTFGCAGLTVVREVKHTPFITTFLLQKNGNPPESHR